MNLDDKFRLTIWLINTKCVLEKLNIQFNFENRFIHPLNDTFYYKSNRGDIYYRSNAINLFILNNEPMAKIEDFEIFHNYILDLF